MKQFFFGHLLFFSILSFGQNTATDFIVSDCDGIDHHLFSKLDEGEIIVLAWVMPCNPCAIYTQPAYLAAHSFSESHPEKVHFYLIDDYANSSCTYISDWAQEYNMPDHVSFSSDDISMSDYGEDGMPKVAVVGGLDHRILFNENDVNITFDAIQLAIENQFNEMAIQDIEERIKTTAFPNPTSGKLRIRYSHKKTNYEILDILGKVLKSGFLHHSEGENHNETSLNLSDLGNGNYFISFYSSDEKESILFSIQ